MRNPAFFRGQRKHRKYFEGWYFKCISADRRHAVAFIPGIAVSPDGDKHAFIQVINAVSGKTWYHHFPFEAFSSPRDRFDIVIGENHFNSNGLSLRIDPSDQSDSLNGALTFSEIRTYPVSRFRPGIMGPFSFIPFMECYHAIVHLSHRLQGQIELDSEVIDFTDGAGYIEKDYGRSFPTTYTWLQASHFEKGDASFVFSRARIPFLGGSFPGFFAYFTDFKEITVRFATYNRSKLIRWEVDVERRTCAGTLSGPDGILYFEAVMSGGGRLRAPVDGLMDREIIESITALVSVRLTDPSGNMMFEDKSSEAGMEISL